MKQLLLFFTGCVWMIGLSSCHSSNNNTTTALPNNWDSIVQQANGQTVQLMMWMGDPLINQYMNEYVKPIVKSRYNIQLNIIPGQGNTIVNQILTEQQAGKKESEIDMGWINGETFYQLRQLNALYGPITPLLPNGRYINFNNPFIKYDFQQDNAGMECPWGNVQMTLIYNSKLVTNPPTTLAELETFVQQHPGKFTFTTDFSGLTFLKNLLIEMAGGNDAIKGPFNQALYNTTSKALFAYINRIKPYFWKQGKTFPETFTPMHQLFANGELYFTMSNNDGEVDNKVAQGIFPDFARSYVMNGGSIQNSHYMGIVKNAAHKAGALVVANFLISPEAQLKKQQPDIWGDGTVLDLSVLPDSIQTKFKQVGVRKYGPERSSIQSKALMEPAAEYMIHLADDFRKYVIEQ